MVEDLSWFVRDRVDEGTEEMRYLFGTSRGFVSDERADTILELV